jgi:hypothetical protein
MLRTRAITLTLAVLVASAGLARAQSPAPAPRLLGSFDVAFRASSIDGDAARFQRYRDFRDRGAGLSITFDHEGPTWAVQAAGRNVGYLDQQFQVAATASKLTLSFEWNQTPLFYGNSTSTAYVQISPGVFSLDPNARLAVQNGTAIGIPRTPLQAESPSIYRALAKQFDLKSRRDSAVLRLAYAATPELALNVEVNSYARSGSQPWGAGFAFSVLPELPLPIDNRTTSVAAGAEWANRKGMLRFGYEGSYFSNHIETLTWDNPVRATDYNQNSMTVTGYDPSGFVTGNGAARAGWPLPPAINPTASTGSVSSSSRRGAR